MLYVVMRVVNGLNGEVVVRVNMKFFDNVLYIFGLGKMYIWYELLIKYEV